METHVIGITGSISVGKSTVTRYLLEKGYQVLDADHLSHHALDKQEECYKKIVECFGCLNEDLSINRKQLGQIVFSNPKKKKQLEDIIHPYVKKKIQEGISSCKDEVIFLDIPLLYETHMESMCEKVIVVYVNEKTQKERLMLRNHINEKEALHLMSQQISIEKKKKWGDYIIDNSSTLEELYQNINRVLKEIEDEVIFK